MYLRTSRRKNRDGTVVQYYQLAHNERHPVTRKPVARVVHSFGRADQLDRGELVRLCRSIARVCNLEVIDLLASLRFKRYLRGTRSHKTRIDRGAIREAAKVDGKWVLETYDDTLRLEDAAEGYEGLMVIERCFRSLKRTQIQISPLYHWLPRRIEAHVKVRVLSLLIERVAEHRYGQPWSRIKRALDELQIFFFHECLQALPQERNHRPCS
jgi:transposase